MFLNWTAFLLSGSFLFEAILFNWSLNVQVSMSSLYMPEPEDAESHGDANLAVDDFWARNPV